MEKQLSYVLRLPLQELSLRRLVIMLWSQVLTDSDFSHPQLSSMKRCDAFPLHYELKSSIEKRLPLVENRLLQLALPKSLFKKATYVIEPIGLELEHWIALHLNLYPCGCEKIFDPTILDKLSWTSVGTIDYRKTAEELIRSEMLDSFVLYQFACLYCLEDYIPPLLEKLPELVKWFSEEASLLVNGQEHSDNFWCYFLWEDVPIEMQFRKPTNSYQHTFKQSALAGNKATVEYFYQKLTNEEREILLFETAQEVAVKVDSCLRHLLQISLSDVLCFLLSKMTPEQHIEFLKRRPYRVLRSYLQWPWQDLFLDIAELAWDFLSADHYCDILKDLSIRGSNSGNIHVDLFREFFVRTPSNFKNSYIDRECQRGCILFGYFVNGDSESIKFVIRNIDAASKRRLAFSYQGVCNCSMLMKDGRSDLLKLFIREAMLSKEDMAKLKELIRNRFSKDYEYYGYKCKIPEWEQFFL